MIIHDQRFANFVASSALALGLFSSLAIAAQAAENDSSVPSTANVQSAQSSQAPAEPALVTIVREGVDYPYSTKARTVGEFFTERELGQSARSATSYDADDAIVDGMRIVIRKEAPVVAPTIARVHLAKHRHAQHPRIVSWTSHVTVPIARKTRNQNSFELAPGHTTIVDAGRAGERLVTYRYVRHGHAKATRTLLASRIVRMPRARVIAHGVAAYASLAHVAEVGFASVAHFAGSAIHMIATAYTAGCYKCSGITASGVRAGFGIIAVDPRVIPLGTKLFIPGYGRAVAGDTGGAILGNRVDLGMNTQRDAIQFGRRPVTVYVLR